MLTRLRRNAIDLRRTVLLNPLFNTQCVGTITSTLLLHYYASTVLPSHPRPLRKEKEVRVKWNHSRSREVVLMNEIPNNYKGPLIKELGGPVIMLNNLFK